MKIPEQTEYRESRKESDLVVTVDKESSEDIQKFIKTIKSNTELLKIDNVRGYCSFVSNLVKHLREGEYKPFEKQLDYLIECVENHGLPEQDHLDEHAEILMKKFNNGYGVLLKDSLTQECFDEVKAHRSGEAYSERYEACLQHLHTEAVIYDRKRKTQNLEPLDIAVNE